MRRVGKDAEWIHHGGRERSVGRRAAGKPERREGWRCDTIGFTYNDIALIERFDVDGLLLEIDLSQ